MRQTASVRRVRDSSPLSSHAHTHVLSAAEQAGDVCISALPPLLPICMSESLGGLYIYCQQIVQTLECDRACIIVK